MFQFRMVADDQRYFAGQVPFADVCQQVIQAMGSFGNKDRHPAAVIAEMEGVFQIHTVCHFRKCFGKGTAGHAVLFKINHNPHVITVFPHIAVLFAFQHVERMACKEPGNFRQNAFAVFGLDQKTCLFCHDGFL